MQPLRNSGDRLLAFGRHPVLRQVLTKLGITLPVDLDRGQTRWFEQPLLAHTPVDVLTTGASVGSALLDPLRGAAAKIERDSATALVVDCTSESLNHRDIFSLLRGVQPKNYRRTTIVFRAGSCDSSRAAASGIGGAIRSLAKEIGARGQTVNGVCVHGSAAPDCLPYPRAVLHTASYLSLPESAFVTGQVVHVGRITCTNGLDDAQLPAAHQGANLKGRFALVTGAAQGIGAAIARRLAREGATVVGVDIPGGHAEELLRKLMSSLAGIAIPLDVSSVAAGAQLVSMLRRAQVSRTDIVVHNAGITRDKTLRRMQDAAIDAVMKVNLEAPLALTDALSRAGLLFGKTEHATTDSGSRVICISSISGIGGAYGQTNYSYSKAALIGWVARCLN